MTETRKPIREPVKVEVRTDREGFPVAVREVVGQTRARARRRARWLQVESVREFWKTEDEWWRGEDRRRERVYFDLVLENGRAMQVFRDLVGGGWYRQSA